MPMMGPMGWGWMVVMAIASLAFWAAVIAVAIWATRRFIDRGHRPGTAREILDERFARGEIDADEYRQRLRVLQA